jgi:small subunit ribosomal protein S13
MRLLGITIPDDKQLRYGMTAVYGIGLSLSTSLIEGLGIDPYSKPTELTTDQENEIRKAIESLTLEGDLRREKSQNIKRLKDIKSYRGSRHEYSLPARGQRSKTNSRTVRGNKRNTMGSGRRKVEKT